MPSVPNGSRRPVLSTSRISQSRIRSEPVWNARGINSFRCWTYAKPHPHHRAVKGKVSPYSIAERRVPELIPVSGSGPAGGVSHKPGGRQPLLSARPAVTLATTKRAASNFAAWWIEARWVWTVCLRQQRLRLLSYPTASWLRFELRPFCAWVHHANHLATEPTQHTHTPV